jgi:CelD/BcsL family acetyltransferase involved in cellulose biosynthesis
MFAPSKGQHLSRPAGSRHASYAQPMNYGKSPNEFGNARAVAAAEAWRHSAVRSHDPPKCLSLPEKNTPESAPQAMLAGLKRASLSRGG